MTKDRLDRVAVLTMLALCAAWGLQQVSVKIAYAGISPIMLAGLRMVGAVVLLWLWSAWRRVRLFDRDGTLWPGLAAGALFAIEFVFLYLGLAYTSASRAVLFLYSAPFVVAIGVHLFVPGERLGRWQVAGLLCAFIGILVGFADGMRLPSRSEFLGDALVFVAAVLWGATTVLIKATRLVRASPNKTLLYQLAVAAVALPPMSVMVGEPGIVRLDGPVLLALAYQTVIVSFVSYLAWFWLMTRYPAGRLSAFTFLTPLFGVSFGWLLLGEQVSSIFLIAMALVCAGIWLVNRPPHPKEATTQIRGVQS